MLLGMSEVDLISTTKVEDETEMRPRKNVKKVKAKEKKINVRELLNEVDDLDLDSSAMGVNETDDEADE